MPVNVIFVQDPVSWNKEFKSWEGIVGKHMTKIVKTTQNAARFEAPSPGRPPRNRTGINYATGELASGIISDRTHTPTGDLEGHVIAVPDHALMLHKGTRPHVIKARNPTGLMTFFWHKAGRVVRFPKVNHPGTMANPFLERALRTAMRLFG